MIQKPTLLPSAGSLRIAMFTFNPIGENTYIIWDDNSKDAAVIDAGMFTSGERRAFVEFVCKESLQLKYSLQTHTHFDHIFGLPFLHEQYGLRPMFHAQEERVYYAQEEMVGMFGIEFPGSLPAMSAFMEDNQSLLLGSLQIQVIHTPGHTPGGVCFHLQNEGVLFSGDTLFRESVGRSDLPGGNMAVELASIKNRLFTLDEKTIVYPGHGSSTSIGWEKGNNLYVQ